MSDKNEQAMPDELEAFGEYVKKEGGFDNLEKRFLNEAQANEYKMVKRSLLPLTSEYEGDKNEGEAIIELFTTLTAELEQVKGERDDCLSVLMSIGTHDAMNEIERISPGYAKMVTDRESAAFKKAALKESAPKAEKPYEPGPETQATASELMRGKLR